MFLNKYLVEFLGSIFFIYITLSTGNPLAIGAALALVMLLAMNISGGYINPAITITMAAAGKIPNTEIIPYCVAQILGGLVALELYKRVRM
jgi:glycerol uptake facilitator-like aquaporin